MKLWQGRLSGEVDERVNKLNSSIAFDSRMYKQDILGSVAHAEMLKKQGIIDKGEADKIIAGLKELLADIESGKLAIDMTAEDIHTFVEATLTERIGDAGKRLHTARSRNDQVATDLRLYCADEIDALVANAKKLCEVLISVSEKNLNTVMSGYTHLQRAQPVTLAHSLMAYVWMLLRDIERLSDCKKRTAILPLGSGALAGTTYALDRKYTAKLLGCSDITYNSIDGVSDRDFVLELLSCLSIIMVHLSRFSEEIILWCSHEFSYMSLSDSFSTGSSIMPQKKNPDIAELARGKAGRLIGNLSGLLATLKALPLAYNRDLQEDKEPVFDSVTTLEVLLPAFAGMVATMRFHEERMAELAPQGFSLATDVAEWLVKRGVPFRDAHEVSGALVKFCENNGFELHEPSDEQLLAVSEHLAPEVREVLSAAGSVASRQGAGGTAPERVAEQRAELIARTQSVAHALGL